MQIVRAARIDCDGDTVLLEVDQTGAACHTGAHRCFDVDPLEPVTASAPDGAASALAGAPSALAGGAVEETR